MQTACRSFTSQTTTLSPSEDPTERVQFRRELRRERRVRRDRQDRISKKRAVQAGTTFEIAMEDPDRYRYDDGDYESPNQRMYRQRDEAAVRLVGEAMRTVPSVSELVEHHYRANCLGGELHSDDERRRISGMLETFAKAIFVPGDIVSRLGFLAGRWLVVERREEELVLVAVDWSERARVEPTRFDVLLGKTLPGRDLVVCTDVEIVVPTAFVKHVFSRIGWIAPTELDEATASYAAWKRDETIGFYLNAREEHWLQRGDLHEDQVSFCRALLRAWQALADAKG